MARKDGYGASNITKRLLELENYSYHKIRLGLNIVDL